jgi:hypothetical protein
MKETGTGEPTPEQLVQILESQLTVRRSQLAHSGRNRAIILVAGILFIVIGAGAALLILDQMLADLRPGDRPSRPASAETPGNF